MLIFACLIITIVLLLLLLFKMSEVGRVMDKSEGFFNDITFPSGKKPKKPPHPSKRQFINIFRVTLTD